MYQFAELRCIRLRNKGASPKDISGYSSIFQDKTCIFQDYDDGDDDGAGSSLLACALAGASPFVHILHHTR